MTDARRPESTPPTPEPAHPLLEGYLDRTLAEADRAAFERVLRDRADLRAIVESQRRVDASMARLFGAPKSLRLDLPGVSAPRDRSTAPLKFDGAAPDAGTSSNPVRKPWPAWWWGVAAALLLAGGLGGYFALQSSSGSRFTRPSELQVAYREQIERGFKPEEICTTDEAFAQWLAEKFMTPMVLASRPEGTELLGWSYPGTDRGAMGALLARVNGEPVVVFIEFYNKAFAPPLALTDPALTMRERRIGHLMLYEVGPANTPSLLPGLEPVSKNPG